MKVDTIEIGPERVTAARAVVHQKGTIAQGRSWEFRADDVKGVPAHMQWPPVFVRCNGDAYCGRVFVYRRDSAGDELYGLLEQC